MERGEVRAAQAAKWIGFDEGRSLFSAVAEPTTAVDLQDGVIGSSEGDRSAMSLALARTLAGRGTTSSWLADVMKWLARQRKDRSLLNTCKREGIRQGPAHVHLDLVESLTEQGKRPLALEAFEEGPRKIPVSWRSARS